MTLIAPKRAEPWVNMGMCHTERMELDEAEHCFRKALQIDPEDYKAMNNMALIELNRCEPGKAIIWADRVLKQEPGFNGVLQNKGLANLMLKKWQDGWKFWDTCLGTQFRKQIRYKEEPIWDGSKGKTLVVYGEQGLGDEISFASCIPDAIRDSKQVIIDCDFRLEGLFRRSFPKTIVYGTRHLKTAEWPGQYDIEASAAVGALPGFYRNRDEDFPGTPYLVADPERRIQWRALLDSLGPEPKIGIAYTGGTLSTGHRKRSLSLEAFLPILKQKAHFVSLQYKDPPDCSEFERMYGIKVHHWKRAVQTDDYDDTAALVSELDLVISVTTAVVHLSGALGVPCWVLTPSKPRWFYGMSGEGVPWYKSMTLYRQRGLNWNEVINHVAGDLAKNLDSLSDKGQRTEVQKRAA